jgi:8-oxo-dGTP diphosphatase
MPSYGKFNVRVYGIWIQEGKVLVNEELIRGKKIIKFPGGGLEFGEGTIDCLKRECMEELGIAVDVTQHFYTTDYFQPSAYDDSQVISIYYLISANEIPAMLQNLMDNERTYWMDMAEVSEESFSLPIDRTVGGMLREKHLKGL